MNTLLRRFADEWPAWLAILFVVCLPIRRFSEVPIIAFAFMLPWLWRSARYRERTRAIARVIVPVFACFWLPMLLSSFDSVTAAKSWAQSLGALRFLAAAISIAVLLHPPHIRWTFLKWTALILLFWAFDGFVQLFLGYDVFGIPMHEDRLNALFFRKFQFYGPVLAMLSPLALEYVRRRWPAWTWPLAYGLILGAVLIAGMRAGWVMMFALTMVYALVLLRSNRPGKWRLLAAMPALGAAAVLTAWFASPIFQARIADSLLAAEQTDTAIAVATSNRAPIFRHALEMYRDHPVNGVGVRGYPVAYFDYAEADDPNINPEGENIGARHPHNFVLEYMADAGTIGLLGLLGLYVLGVVFWRALPAGQRREALPFALALFLIYFPLNSHFAAFGTYISTLTWFVAGLFFAVVDPRTGRSAVAQDSRASSP
ncbi:O-antigen ligase family protein [Marinihelvus fidelis]|uniref:O-antigen ligase family protein n=1 Tax=Marinihelvus fidelis TaxID=2613842 RepID=A0A5N0TCF0_9GAMM|nr:O-antigen ligase family protein [Marinihelvus fidelis]KAA9131516.1 O-antigen ligase family protein [Marinihelvus fidelis]